jgi:hypothetical protein
MTLFIYNLIFLYRTQVVNETITNIFLKMNFSNFRLSLFIGIFLLSVAGCSNQPAHISQDGISIQNPTYGTLQQEDHPFTFERVETIRLELPKDFILSSISSFQALANGDFYFMDRKQHKLISVDKTGKLRWMIGQKGRGPGDFENAYSMIANDDFVYVGNLQGTRLDIFNTEGGFVNSINLNKDISFGYVSGFLTSGELVISAPYWDSWGHSLYIAELGDDSISVQHHFNIDQAKGLKMKQGVTASSTINIIGNKIYSGSVLDYSFEVYKPDGELVQKVQRDFDRIVRPGMYASGNSTTIWNFGSVDAPYAIGDDYLLVSAQWPTNVSDPDGFVKRSQTGGAPKVKYQNSLDIFDTDGTLLYSIESDGQDPDIGDISYVDKAGIIYVAEAEPEPVIKKYKLVRN